MANRSTSGFALMLVCMTLAHHIQRPRMDQVPQGPNGSGFSPAKTIPVEWTADDYNWRVALPGKGFSSPVVWGDKIFVTSIVEKEFKKIVCCLRTSDGGLIWQQELPLKVHPKWKDNCDDSSSPAVDGDHLYLSWATPDEYVVVALHQSDGRLVWRRDLGPWVAEDGFASSPVLFEDMVILANDQDEGGTSSMVALDRKTGETRWKNPRRTLKASFSTPCLYKPKGRARPVDRHQPRQRHGGHRSAFGQDQLGNRSLLAPHHRIAAGGRRSDIRQRWRRNRGLGNVRRAAR